MKLFDATAEGIKLYSTCFDRIEKAWMTVTGGGDDERPEWPQLIYELEEMV